MLESIGSAIDFVETNSGVVTTIATVIIAVSAISTAWLTRSLAKENRLLRKLGNEPQVIAYLVASPRHPAVIDFVLSNVGHGPARNIEFSFDFDECFYGNGRVAPMNRADRAPYGFLLQGEKIRMLFGSGGGLIGENGLPPFRANIKWENMTGKPFDESYKMDVQQFSGTFTGTSTDHEIAKSLEKISKRLDCFASAGTSERLKVETMTTDEVRQHRLEREQRAAAKSDRPDASV